MANTPIDRLSDEELDRYILTRLALAGVDISILPEADAEAPADRERLLRSARKFLRSTVPVLSNLRLDPNEFPPILYPASLPSVELDAKSENDCAP